MGGMLRCSGVRLIAEFLVLVPQLALLCVLSTVSMQLSITRADID